MIAVLVDFEIASVREVLRARAFRLALLTTNAYTFETLSFYFLCTFLCMFLSFFSFFFDTAFFLSVSFIPSLPHFIFRTPLRAFFPLSFRYRAAVHTDDHSARFMIEATRLLRHASAS